jgi:transposase-like protein
LKIVLRLAGSNPALTTQKSVLIKEIAESGYSATGRKYGVSDNAIRKWVKD